MKRFVPVMQLILPIYLTALLLSGCASTTLQMYKGSKLPDDQIATIGTIGPQTASTNYFDFSARKSYIDKSLVTFILEIDGQKLKLEDVNKHVFLEVLPGEHRMEVAANVGDKSIDAPDPLIFLVEAGENYLVMAGSEEGPEENQILFHFWVMDSSGNVVAGTKDLDIEEQ